MNILALDLATCTGFAAIIDGARESGSVIFKPRKNETHGWKYIRFSAWLYKWQSRGLDLVIYEKPIPFHLGQAASELAFGFSSRVEEFASRCQIPCQSIQPTVLKKWATGKGNAQKEDMVRAAQMLKRGVVDHNESDALWILQYAIQNSSEKARTA